MKEQILAILNEYRKDMENYSYFGSNYGVSEDDFEDIAEKIIALEGQRLKDAEEVIAFYADINIYEITSDTGEQVKHLALPDSEAEWMDGGDMKANYWGGKRAREYLKKYGVEP